MFQQVGLVGGAIVLRQLGVDGGEGDINVPLFFPQLKIVFVLVEVERWRSAVRLEGGHLE